MLLWCPLKTSQAGLFSAVVTAFTVESYKWLQEDPGDTSAKLLANISVQLSSFIVAPGVVNSTFRVPSLTDHINAPFTPDALSVTINTLWIASLSLSLIAAFYAIAVLQWLRCVPIPLIPTFKAAVRFRQSRHDSLDRWHVTTIVSLLPILMQVAVGLFFLGLFLLLQSLNRTVSTLFAVLVGVPLLFFGFSVVAPIIWSKCPYKSPIIPTAQMLLLQCLRPFFSAFYLTSTHLLKLFRFANHTLFLDKEPRRTIALDRRVATLLSQLDHWRLSHSPRRVAAGIEGFWNHRDRVATADSAQDIPALSRASILLTGEKLNDTIPCLEGIPLLPWMSIAIDIAFQTLNGCFTQRDYIDYSPATFVNPALLAQVDTDYLEVTQDYLLSLLQGGSSALHREPGFTTVLLLLEKVVDVELQVSGRSASLEPLTQRVLDMCCEQRIYKLSEPQGRYPSEVLYRCCIVKGHKLEPTGEGPVFLTD